MTNITRIFVTLAASASWSGAALAQRAASCAVASLSYGISALDCVHCTVHTESGSPWVEYASEPVVRDVIGGFPSDSTLVRGDVIVSIDGKLITTRAGATRLATPVAGKSATFSIRRADRAMIVTITPRCTNATAVPGAGAQVTRGAGSGSWLGFAFVSVRMAKAPSGSVVGYRYAEFPNVGLVEARGPAERAGLQAGDILRSVDGLSITTPEGTQRLGSIKPNETVMLMVERAGTLVKLTLTAVPPGGS